MNINKLTQRSAESIAAAQTLAAEQYSAQVEQEHLMLALLRQENGVVPQLFTRMGADVGKMEQELSDSISRMPRLSGGRPANQVYISSDLDAALAAAERQTDRMRDEYVSVEHLTLGMLEKPVFRLKTESLNLKILLKRVFSRYLRICAVPARVTSDTPEGTYDALKKYGTDLVGAGEKPKTGSCDRKRQRNPGA